MNVELVALRLVHILGGTFWVGSGLFTSLFLIPALAGAGTTAGDVMARLQQRRLFTVLPTVAVLTILSGLRLMWIASAGFDASYFASMRGRTFALSGGAAIIAFGISLLIGRPAAESAARLVRKLAAASDGSARAALAADLEGVRRRGAVANAVAVALLVVGAAGMAIARALG